MTTTQLIAMGFTEVGSWQADDTLKSGIRFTLTSMHNSRAIYAYVVEQEVKYVGVCDNTTTTLEDRMKRYQSLAGAGTNERIARLIQGELAEGRQVLIYAWAPHEEFHCCDLTVDLVKGLENPLIAKLEPGWNIKG
jgi:hypothetical protein